MGSKQMARRAGTLLTLLLLAGVLVSVAGAHAASPVDYAVTTPRAFFGYDIGDDYKLTPWQTHVLSGEGERKGIVEYAHELERTSERVHVFTEGTSEQGRPMILTVITSPANWAQMPNLKGILRKLADPRQVASDDEAQLLASQGKAVYWLSAAIHADERTSPETLLKLGYDLASGNDEWTLNTLDNLIVVLENSINPDGVDIVTDWYYQWKDTPSVGSTPPYYNKYVGHDNNRDFLGEGLAETRANTAGRVEWNPTVYHDLHEAMDLLYMSPGPDPTNLAVSPITMAEWLAFAGHNLAQLAAEGWKGAFTYDYADMWYPGYNHGWSFMHNSNGRFYELQGATYATPLLTTSPLGPHTQRAWYDPAPYTATVSSPLTWRLADAVNLEKDALKNDLTYAARQKDLLLYNFYVKAKSNMAKAVSQGPYAFVIPQDGGDKADVTDMINNLHEQQRIEVNRAGADFIAGGRHFGAGDYVVLTHQPYGLTAKNLLEVQSYPAGIVPYDVTAWTYGLLRDVQVVAVTETLPASLSLIPLTTTVSYGSLPAPASTAGISRWVLAHDSNNNLAKALPRLLKDNRFMLRQSDAPITFDGSTWAAGSFVIDTDGSVAANEALETFAWELGLSLSAANTNLPAGVLHLPKVGVFSGDTISYFTMPEGWVRLNLDKSEFDYTRLYPADISAGNLADYSVIILPDYDPQMLVDGIPPWAYAYAAPGHRDGIGAAGVANLKRFVENGGLLVAMGQTVAMPINAGWALGVQVAIANNASAPSAPAVAGKTDLSARSVKQLLAPPDFGGRKPAAPVTANAVPKAPDFNCPGSILRVQVDANTRMGYGYDAEEALWCDGSTQYLTVAPGSQATVVASYPSTGPLLLSGYLSGEDTLRGKAAVVDAPLGKGKVVLLASNVLYRAQATGSYMFFWNALIEGSRLRLGQYLPTFFTASTSGGGLK